MYVSATGSPALRYQWYRGTAGDVSQPLAGKTTRFLEATAGSSAARYWARISNARGSVNSATATVTVPFADDPLIVRSSVIRAAHITELRARIDAVRLRVGLSAYPFAQSVTAGTLVRSSHIAELRVAVQQVYSSLGVTAPVYTSGANAGDPIRALDLQELRAAVQQVE